MLNWLLGLALFPILVFSNMNEKYTELFAEKLIERNINGCHQILDEWERYEPHILPTIQGLRATVLLFEGNIVESAILMYGALDKLEGTTLSEETVQSIRELYAQARNFQPEESKVVSSQVVTTPNVVLCRGNQPKGVKMKYWFGVAQIVAACVVAPFNPPVAGALAISGINTTVQAAVEALDNKESWERNLNERQHMNPDTMGPSRKTSYLKPHGPKEIVLAIVSSRPILGELG